MHKLNRKLPFLYLVLLTLGMSSNTLEANVNHITGQLSLMAMTDGKPAFRPTTWHITCENTSQYYNTTITRHTAVIDVEPGKCTVNVTMGNKTHTRHILIKENKKHSIIVNLD